LSFEPSSWTVWIQTKCCKRGPYYGISTKDKDDWMLKHGETIYCPDHDWYTDVVGVSAHGN